MDIEILVGTMTGNAEIVAQEIELTYGSAEVRITVTRMDDLRPDVFEHDSVFLICTSTYGSGDVPDNAQDFFEALQKHKPDLSQVRYGVLGLGDRTFQDTFNFGGRKFDSLLESLGAQRIGERATLDASDGSMPEEVAVPWMATWLDEVRLAQASRERASQAA
jgi:MioC protein